VPRSVIVSPTPAPGFLAAGDVAESALSGLSVTVGVPQAVRAAQAKNNAASVRVVCIGASKASGKSVWPPNAPNPATFQPCSEVRRNQSVRNWPPQLLAEIPFHPKGGICVSVYDPEMDGPYGDWLKSKNVRRMPSTHATRDQVAEGETPRGGRFKRVTDQLGNEGTQRTEPGGSEHQDVTINLGGPGGDN
jgi:hypothetical protein